jgi:hypothetical protein
MGVATLNRLKAKVMETMTNGWERYVAFLAVDTDYEELMQARFLNRNEMICTTIGDVAESVSRGRNFWPAAWANVASEEQIQQLWHGFMGRNGSGANRLVGKLALYHKNPIGTGADEQFVQVLRGIRNDVLAPAKAGVVYQIYVVAGLGGGTGSGMIPQLPALIRQVFHTDEAVISAVAYLPDVMCGRNPQFGSTLEANGYAALKELSHYMDMASRDGATADFPCNSAPDGKQTMELHWNYYFNIWLVGTPNGPCHDAQIIAMDTVTEYLGGILSGALEEPWAQACFRTMGCAAGVSGGSERTPEVWAWSVKELCDRAGLIPVSDERRQEMMAMGGGVGFLPFLGVDQRETPEELNQHTSRLLHPLRRYMGSGGVIPSSVGNAIGPVAWQAVANGSVDADVARYRKHMIDRATGVGARASLEENMKAQFRIFREAAKQYVMNYGPMAFWNLYIGNAAPADDQRAVGIRESLERIMTDSCKEPDIQYFTQKMNELRHALNEQGAGVMAALRRGKLEQMADEWLHTCDQMIKAEICGKWREYMLGRNGILDTCFVQPARRLAQEIYTFGKILETIIQGYGVSGRVLNSDQEVRELECGLPLRRIYGMDSGSYGDLMNRLRENIGVVDLQRFRSDLVGDFFENPEAWLQVSMDQIRCLPGGGVQMIAGVAPARMRFDHHVAERIRGIRGTQSVCDVLQGSGDPQRLARNLGRELAGRSLALCNGGARAGQNWILMPQQMQNVAPNLAYEVCQGAAEVLGEYPVLRTVKEDDSIRVFRCPRVQLRDLRDLARWEREYSFRLNAPGNGLHGLSPEQIAGGDRPWRDYPRLNLE